MAKLKTLYNYTHRNCNPSVCSTPGKTVSIAPQIYPNTNAFSLPFPVCADTGDFLEAEVGMPGTGPL